MKRYESYKDSGVKWLGEIPGHWEVRKIKYTFKERSQKGLPKRFTSQCPGISPSHFTPLSF